jgi:anti-anti-sigma factor
MGLVTLIYTENSTFASLWRLLIVRDPAQERLDAPPRGPGTERIMTMDVRHMGDVSVVGLSGRVTIDEGDRQLRRRVKELLARDHKDIRLLLKDVLYMDSAGLAALITCQRLTHEHGGTFKLVDPSPRIVEALSITGLDRLFETCGTDALAS